MWTGFRLLRRVVTLTLCAGSFWAGMQYGQGQQATACKNAGGVVTDDVIRSLVLSQRFLGTREIILVHHTNCGLQAIDEDNFKNALEAEVGIKPWWALECFADPYADTRQSINRLQHSPFIKYKDHIRGFVYDVADGRLREA